MYGFRIKELRIEKRLTQDELSDILNLSRQAISAWETEINEPDIPALIKLSEYFNVSIDYLVGTTNIKQNYKQDPNLESYLIDCINTYKKHINKD
ncbi:helix-turn-helix domain-containing protein [Clostridium culturomicium]|uniref:helix-turn-helix domain-containing protein n=1 Tax=Clostridium culturomicium TaxID=1499683 RepID=UPI00058B4C9A|nr:helix-turn-helix transcriptional regulator [Clostridium culturomicium]